MGGLVRGGWILEEPGRAPAALPWPGVCQARAPLGWYDSVAVRPRGAAGGLDGALAGVRAMAPAGERRARSTFSLANGSAGLDDYALTLARGDSLRAFGLDVMSGRRGAAAGFERSGRHLWGLRARATRGEQQFDANVAQRGTATQLAGLEEQAASGQSGTLGWRWLRGGTVWRAGFERGLDRHESFGGALERSEREAQETRFLAGGARASAGRLVDAQLQWTEATVKRIGNEAFARDARTLWGTARAELPAAGGRLELALGGGRLGGVDRWEVAPAATWRARGRGLDATIALEHDLAPVWADLAPGAAPFLQHSWIGTLGIATAGAGPWRARATLRAGRVHERALAERLPLEELWLRAGLRDESGTYDLALADGALEWQGRHAGAGLDGFGLAHRSSASAAGAPRADPDAGFRAWTGVRATFFGGDLGVALRGEAAGIGARVAGLAPPRRLPGYVTCAALCELTLGDAVIVVRARNLEDRPRPQSWIDSVTGLPALTGRRDLGLSLTWRLFN